MSWDLSASALYQIRAFREDDDLPGTHYDQLSHEMRMLHLDEWALNVPSTISSELSARAIDQIMAFADDFRPPPSALWPRNDDDKLEYQLRRLYLDKLANNSHRLLERRLNMQNALGEKDVQDISAHEKPLLFDEEDYPRLLVPKIVEAFQHLTKEPSFLDITVDMPNRLYTPGRAVFTDDHPTELWPQVYDSYLPCGTCTTVETSTSCQIKDDGSWNPLSNRRPLPAAKQYAVEKFHVASSHFDKKLNVELHFALGSFGRYAYGDQIVLPPTAAKEEKLRLHKMTIRLDDGGCRGSMHAATRKRKSMLLILDFATEVYGFVDRVNIGTSLIANRGLNELLFKLRHRLPVHHLMCEFEETPIRDAFDLPPREAYWMIVHHFRRDVTYSDVRRFRIPSVAGLKSTAADCALIVRYLSNSHVAEFKAPPDEPRFSIKMLAALVDHNFSMGRLRLRALDDPLTDYRSLVTIFGGGMRLGALNLWIYEDCLQRLIKTTDFLRMPAMQGLKEFKLSLVYSKSSTRWQRAVLSSPLWTAGIHHLRNCALYQVDWLWEVPTGWAPRSVCSAHSKRNLKSIAFKLVEMCEKFERDVSETVGNCELHFATRLAFPFKEDKKIAFGIRVKSWNTSMWDVYRYRNAATGEWLTACVGHTTAESALRIVKGEAYPDDSYAFYLRLM